MKLVILGLVLFGLSGCSTVLMKDCKQEANSKFFYCKRLSAQERW